MASTSAATAALLPLVYAELRSLAAAWFRQWSPGQTLQPTVLVHEAYARLAEADKQQWESRAHFLAVASRVMRQVLIDHVRRRRATKRGGGWQRLTLNAAPSVRGWNQIDFIALDEALHRLTAMDARKSQVVEMRLFGGLTGEAIAAALGVSRATVESDWRVARAWLRTQLLDGVSS